MNTKLTLKLDEYIIEKAKLYAKRRNTSISKLIEKYLGLLTSSKSKKNEISPLVQSISGIVNFSKNYNHKKAYKLHLTAKYSK
jgi:hypothetical protein